MSTSTADSLAAIFAGALGGYVDSQNNQPISAIAPAPQTQYGYAGYPQAAPGSGGGLTSSLGSSSTLLIVGVVIVAAVLLLKRRA